jgi:hypothetical protein
MSMAIQQAAQGTGVDLAALGDSQGYRVDGADGRVGVVDGVVAGAWSDRPDAIEVRVGLFQAAILVVGVEDVLEVDPARRRVIVRGSIDLADAYSP